MHANLFTDARERGEGGEITSDKSRETRGVPPGTPLVRRDAPTRPENSSVDAVRRGTPAQRHSEPVVCPLKMGQSKNSWQFRLIRNSSFRGKKLLHRILEGSTPACESRARRTCKWIECVYFWKLAM
jgi:hypothetical protein